MAANLQRGPVPYRPDPYIYLRPDFVTENYENKTLLQCRVHGPSEEENTTVWYTVIIIVISALIFITLIAWADVLRTWFEARYGNREIAPILLPGLLYAIAITIIATIAMVVLLFFLKSKRRK